jgi:hypothetical protein
MPSHRPSEGVAAAATVPATVFRIFGDGPKSYDIAIYDDTIDTKTDTWKEKQFRAERIGKTLLPLPTKRRVDPEKKAVKTESITPVKREPTYTKAVICVSTGKYYGSQRLACSGENVKEANIGACLNGRTKTAGKKLFRYATTDEKIAGRLLTT